MTPTTASPNQHPAVMFEIMAQDREQLTRFYVEVFNWQVDVSDGFGYVRFPIAPRALLGGIGQARPGVVGWHKGVAFYLEVPRIDDALIQKITQCGGTLAVPRQSAGGYAFAMFEDPEHNLVGLIESF